MAVFVIRATHRTNWIFVQLKTNRGLTGLGEASLGRRAEAPELAQLFELVREQSPFEISKYRERGWNLAKSGDLSLATAFSAIEQAQWDLVGKALDAPVYDLFGGKLRNELPIYANINRATVDRSPAFFAVNAKTAVEDGFAAIKAAPFDGFPQLSAPQDKIERATQIGIACVESMREAVGPEVKLKIDCHSHFSIELAVSVAHRLEPQELSWYEEPVAPQKVDETRAIRGAISQRIAGGEMLFGMEAFAPLCQEHAVDVIMPDVKHCGGILEGWRIASLAELHNVSVSPHNPSGPVATAATVQLCAGMTNFEILEYQWNEVPWRADLIDPPEQIQQGQIRVPDKPGFGVELNEKAVQEHLLMG
jgi:galactonate dehydratase